VEQDDSIAPSATDDGVAGVSVTEDQRTSVVTPVEPEPDWMRTIRQWTDDDVWKWLLHLGLREVLLPLFLRHG
jgi:glutathione synthase/RimK-type ligase-like ATP-grasp enzyme